MAVLVLCADGVYEMPQPIGLFAGQLHERSREFLAAFRKLQEDTVRATHPSCFLACHCLELALKSFLAAKGLSKAKLRSKSFGHDVVKALAECAGLGMPAVADLDAFARTMNEMNKDFDFRYPSGYNLHVPRPDVTETVLTALLGAIRSEVDTAAWQAQQQYANDTRHLQGNKVRWSD